MAEKFNLIPVKEVAESARQTIFDKEKTDSALREDEYLDAVKSSGIPCLECRHYVAKKEMMYWYGTLGRCSLLGIRQNTDRRVERPIWPKRHWLKDALASVGDDYGFEVDIDNFNNIPENCPDIDRVHKWVDDFAKGGEPRYIRVPYKVRVTVRK